MDRNLRQVGAVPLVDVALRKESVDRNVFAVRENMADEGRSPQGERG